MATRFSLGRQERLKSSLDIQDLLKNGRSVSCFPFKVYWEISREEDQKSPVRMAVSVPKRKFRRAVDRNLMKRRIREAYRHNKELIYSQLRERQMNIILIILFLSDELMSFERLNGGMRELLGKLPDKF